MEVQTTVYMHNEILEKLNNASNVLKISRSSIIKTLLGEILKEKKINMYRSAIKYQNRDISTNWSKFHLTVQIDDYEYYLDLRKVYKMSLSFIIAFAVMNLLDKLFNKIYSVGTDNYLYKYYLFSYKIIDNIVSIRFYWRDNNIKVLLSN